MSEKIYCGSGKIKDTQFGIMPEVMFHKDDITKMAKWMADNNSDFIRLNMKEKKELVEGKPTHYLEVNTWKPVEQSTKKSDEVQKEFDLPEPGVLPDDDLPF